MRVTISMPSYERPKRTIRAIESICLQTANGWEALIVGDNCPVIKDLLDSRYFDSMVKDCNARGNILSIKNNSERFGGCGYKIINDNIQNAKGKYFVFMGNDDYLLPNHLELYLSGIEGSDLDFVHYNTFIGVLQQVRVSDISQGQIGHSELIVRSDFLRTMPSHSADYGHDWQLVENMVRCTSKHHKVNNRQQTYIVMGVGQHRKDTID